MYYISFLAYALQVLAKPIKFYTVTDKDRQTEYSYLTYDKLIDNREMFEKDDEVGSIFYQIKETIEKYKEFNQSN